MAPSFAIPALSVPGSRAQGSPLSNVTPVVAGLQPAAVVSEAAAILDEEMAKGVLAAQGASPPARYGASDRSSNMLRQVHDLIDNVAQVWPSLQGVSPQWSGASGTGGSSADQLPELKPAAALRPGQRTTISMTLCNNESRPVRLVPVATDLLGNTGGRIASQLLSFAPREVRLEPGERKEMEIALTIPAEVTPGCYSGLLVVTGVDYLRALVVIKVT